MDSGRGQAEEEIVILIHGTFAGDKERSNTGSRWWQIGSDTWTWFAENLPPGVRLAEDHLVFHWSGENTWTARLDAATDLLALIMRLERQGRAYHLVAHSHGGSVIWEALLTCVASQQSRRLSRHLEDALKKRWVLPRLGLGLTVGIYTAFVDWWWHPLFTARKQRRRVDRELDLRGLRSWTTVGTPFIWHLPRGGRFIKGWRHSKFELRGEVRAVHARWTLWPFLASVAGTVLVYWLALVTWNAPGIGVHVARSVGLAALAVSVVMWPYVSGAVSRAAVAHSLTTRARLARRAFTRFGDRWLGLHAPTDEALAVLRSLRPVSAPPYEELCAPRAHRQLSPCVGPGPSLPLAVRLNVPRNRVSLVPDLDLSNWYSDVLSRAWGGLNRWVAPRLNKALAERITRTGQGCDVRHAELVYVSTWPLPLSDDPQGLPHDIGVALEQVSLAHANELGPSVRQMVAQVAMSSATSEGTLVAARSLAGGMALVHTLYFDNLNVRRLIRLHIAGSSHIATAHAAGDGGSLQSWIDETRERVAQRIRDLHLET